MVLKPDGNFVCFFFAFRIFATGDIQPAFTVVAVHSKGVSVFYSFFLA